MLLARNFPALLTAALILISPLSYAEEADWPGFALIRNSTIHVGKNAEYEAFLKELVAADKAADASANRIIEGGIIADGGLYTHISFHTDFTDLREPIGYLQVHGDDAWRKLVAGLDSIVQHTERKIYLRRPELGRADPDLDPQNIELWYTYHVEIETGANDQFEQWLTKLVEATAKVDPETYWYTYSPWLNTGNVYRITSATTLEGLNSPVMNPEQRMEAAFGKREADRLAELNADSVVSVQQTLLRHRLDLSYIAD